MGFYLGLRWAKITFVNLIYFVGTEWEKISNYYLNNNYHYALETLEMLKKQGRAAGGRFFKNMTLCYKFNSSWTRAPRTTHLSAWAMRSNGLTNKSILLLCVKKCGRNMVLFWISGYWSKPPMLKKINGASPISITLMNSYVPHARLPSLVYNRCILWILQLRNAHQC